MACFLVPAAEAIVTTITAKILKSREEKNLVKSENNENNCTEICTVKENCKEETFSQKLNRLSGFLWGGSGLLAFEHLWHGEISPVFPFLTAVDDPSQMAEVFHEMSTVGVGMAAAVTLFWALITLGMDFVKKYSSGAGVVSKEE